MRAFMAPQNLGPLRRSSARFDHRKICTGYLLEGKRKAEFNRECPVLQRVSAYIFSFATPVAGEPFLDGQESVVCGRSAFNPSKTYQ
jgi:hypothetical protein